MTPLHIVAATAIGLAGGLLGNVTGIASVVSYPALLALGLPPIVANATNSVANMFGGMGAMAGSQRELEGQRSIALRLSLVAVIGGATGGALLLVISSADFQRLVPWLITFASVAILVPPRPARAANRTRSMELYAAMFLISIYGGFFGAAAGVVGTALLLHMRNESLARTNALRALIFMVANAVAAVLFAVKGIVYWPIVLPLAAGFFLGGAVGPQITRRAPIWPLKIVISVVGLGLAADLAADAYHLHA